MFNVLVKYEMAQAASSNDITHLEKKSIRDPEQEQAQNTEMLRWLNTGEVRKQKQRNTNQFTMWKRKKGT